MKPREQLAILTAIKKAVDQRIKDIRAVADEELLDAYYDDGVEKLALKIDNQKVGDFTVTFTKEGYTIEDQDALNDFALDYGMAYFYSYIDPDKMEDAISYLNEFEPSFIKSGIKLYDDWDKAINYIDGECTYMDSGVIIPGLKYKPREVKTTMVRGCKPEDVLPITRRLGGVDNLLLGE